MLQKNSKGRVNDRRISALARLKEMERTGKTLKEKRPLDDNDKKRVASEINKLESIIVTSQEARGVRTKKDRSATGKRGEK